MTWVFVLWILIINFSSCQNVNVGRSYTMGMGQSISWNHNLSNAMPHLMSVVTKSVPNGNVKRDLELWDINNTNMSCHIGWNSETVLVVPGIVLSANRNLYMTSCISCLFTKCGKPKLILLCNWSQLAGCLNIIVPICGIFYLMILRNVWISILLKP